MRTHTIAAATVLLALALTGCASTPAEEPAAPSLTPSAPTCLTVTDAQAAAISEGVQPGITLTDWNALPAETGPGAWFISAHANGPGLEDEPFIFFTGGNAENYTPGMILAADNVTAAFVDWPMQEGAMLDTAFDTVKDCLPVE